MVGIETYKKIGAGALLALSLYTVVVCPCEVLVECHKLQFWGSWLLAGAIVGLIQ
jgi:hypothetical protein